MEFLLHVNAPLAMLVVAEKFRPLSLHGKCLAVNYDCCRGGVATDFDPLAFFGGIEMWYRLSQWCAVDSRFPQRVECNDMSIADLINPVVDLAYQAGQQIMDIYHSDFTVTRKDDQSPLTAADLAAHECLVNGLLQLNPQLPVLSEESTELPFAQRKTWESYWLIDPLDGTKEFVKRNGEFTVNIALIHRHKPVLGVVYAPVLNCCYYATLGSSAYKILNQSAAEKITARRVSADPPVVVGSRSHASESLRIYLDRLGQHQLKPIGSSLKFCLVAEGLADLYPRLGPTSEWDTAAAQCIVESAGGQVMDWSGNPLRYNTKPSLLNPHFLVFADASKPWLAYGNGIADGISGLGQHQE